MLGGRRKKENTHRFEVPEFWAASGEVGGLWFGVALCLVQRIRSGRVVEFLLHVHSSLDQYHTTRLSEEPGVSAVNRQSPEFVGYANRGEFVVARVEVFLPGWSMTLHTPGGALWLFAAHRP